MIRWCFSNKNPKAKKTGDCVIRALSEASGIPYETVYQDLYISSVFGGRFINDSLNYEPWLAEHGFVKFKQPRYTDRTKCLIRDLDHFICTRDAAIVVSCANHLTAVVGGWLFDTWDCSGKTVGNYWVKYKEVM